MTWNGLFCTDVLLRSYSLTHCHWCGVCASVLIIDDAQKDADKKIVMEFTFVQPVMSVRLRMDR